METTFVDLSDAHLS
ncbi:hypothetical protein RDI58_011476 [Solanum bulbocastanum]|uniref:Uncharacterized protein n=1 Tax=Solanum bulbocastanum TaxID=147425 RepID=A0AAN8TR64_SOLBU